MAPRDSPFISRSRPGDAGYGELMSAVVVAAAANRFAQLNAFTDYQGTLRAKDVAVCHLDARFYARNARAHLVARIVRAAQRDPVLGEMAVWCMGWRWPL